MIQSQHEVWKIPKDADSVPYQVLGLRFPALSKEYFIVRFDDCRGRPSSHATALRTSPKPFHTSVDETMIITIVNIAYLDGFGPTFTLFMRHRSLLETITSLTQMGMPPPFDVRHHFNKELISSDESGAPCSFSFAGFQAASSHKEGYNVKLLPCLHGDHLFQGGSMLGIGLGPGLSLLPERNGCVLSPLKIVVKGTCQHHQFQPL
jgi:hypothetical protein